MDIIPFLYLLFAFPWMIFTSSSANDCLGMYRRAWHIVLCVHSVYLMYFFWQWYLLLVNFLPDNSEVNWSLLLSKSAVKNLLIIVLPLLLLFFAYKKNKWVSIILCCFFLWAYVDQLDLYRFSFFKIALVLSLYTTIYALLWLIKNRRSTS